MQHMADLGHSSPCTLVHAGPAAAEPRPPQHLLRDAAAFTHSTAPPGTAAPHSLAHCPPHLLGQQGGLIAVGLISSAAFLPSSL